MKLEHSVPVCFTRIFHSLFHVFELANLKKMMKKESKIFWQSGDFLAAGILGPSHARARSMEVV